MKIQFFTLFLLCVLTVSFFVGCQNSGNKVTQEQETVYRETFTQEEQEQGYAEFELMENVSVKANLTPVSKYKNGLSQYTMETSFETTDLKKTKDFSKNPTLFKKPLSEVLKLLSKKIKGKFDKKEELSYLEGRVRYYRAFQGEGGVPYDMCAFWNTGSEEFNNTKQLYSAYMYITAQNGTDGIDDLAYQVKKCLWNYSETQISFLEDKEQMGIELKKYLEGMLGFKLNDFWDFIPVTEKITEKLAPDIPLKEEYCIYRFYRDVDGLPYAPLALSYDLKEGEIPGKVASMAKMGTRLLGLDEWKYEICLSEKGILKLSVSDIRKEGEAYKEAQNILAPDKILENIREYYARQFLTEPIVITDIRLVYSGYFENMDGMLEPVVSPFWVVTAYEGDITNKKFAYDAINGMEAFVTDSTYY